ncbi:hypothetical protein M885DRAFT_516609 [Pelagophyceae sp. CCMP2097]|nr:hypothetical protein M885DRAFT_516609 [Pelagophyceae sp. CCMP2097]
MSKKGGDEALVDEGADRLAAASNAHGLALIKRVLVDKRLVETADSTARLNAANASKRAGISTMQGTSQQIFVFVNSKLEQNYDAVAQLEAALSAADTARSAAMALWAAEEDAAAAAQATEAGAARASIAETVGEAKALIEFSTGREALAADIVALRLRRADAARRRRFVDDEARNAGADEAARLEGESAALRSQRLSAALDAAKAALPRAAKGRIRQRTQMQAELALHGREASKIENANARLRRDIAIARESIRSVRRDTDAAAHAAFQASRKRSDSAGHAGLISDGGDDGAAPPDDDDGPVYDDATAAEMAVESAAVEAAHHARRAAVAAADAALQREVAARCKLADRANDLEAFYARVANAPALAEARAVLAAACHVLGGKASVAAAQQLTSKQRKAFLDAAFAALNGNDPPPADPESSPWDAAAAATGPADTSAALAPGCRVSAAAAPSPMPSPMAPLLSPGSCPYWPEDDESYISTAAVVPPRSASDWSRRSASDWSVASAASGGFAPGDASTVMLPRVDGGSCDGSVGTRASLLSSVLSFDDLAKPNALSSRRKVLSKRAARPRRNARPNSPLTPVPQRGARGTPTK